MKKASLLLLLFCYLLLINCSPNTISSTLTSSEGSTIAAVGIAKKNTIDPNALDDSCNIPLVVIGHSNRFDAQKLENEIQLQISDSYQLIATAYLNDQPISLKKCDTYPTNNDGGYSLKVVLRPVEGNQLANPFMARLSLGEFAFNLKDHPDAVIFNEDKQGALEFKIDDAEKQISLNSYEFLVNPNNSNNPIPLNLQMSFTEIDGKELGMVRMTAMFMLSQSGEEALEELIEEPDSPTMGPLLPASRSEMAMPSTPEPKEYASASDYSSPPASSIIVAQADKGNKTAKPKSLQSNEPATTEMLVEESASIAPTPKEDIAGEISGRLIEYFPDTMEVGKLSRVIIEISPDTSEAGLKMEIQQHSTLANNQSEIKTTIISGIGENMKATLKGDKEHFEIDPMTDNSLRMVDLSSRKFIRWEWDVRPLKRGDHELSLVLERIEGAASDPVPIMTRKVTVMIEPTFLSKYGILIGVLLLALIGGLLFYFRKSKKQTEELIFQHRKKVLTLIGNSKTEKALNLLEEEFADKSINDEIAMIKSRYKGMKEKELKGLLDHETVNLERNKINHDILELMKLVD